MIFIITLIVIILILYLYKKLSTETFQDSILATADTADATDTAATSNSEFFGTYLKRSLLYIFLFLLLTVNLIALSVSLQCNKESNIFYKMASGLFAFMFGILYLIFNYYMYRVKVNNKPCVICKDDVFGLSTTE